MTRMLCIVSIVLHLLAALCIAQTKEETSPYQTKANEGAFPYPSAFPVVTPGNTGTFDWKRYVKEAASEADKAFRANVALKCGFRREDLFGIRGAGESNSDDMVRYQLARDEMAQGCNQLEALYREKLKDQKKLLAVLNQFIVARRLAIDAEVKLVGGSWDGGSGARVAYPSARLHALVNYRLALDDLRSSLHLQDLPPVPRVATVKPKAKE